MSSRKPVAKRAAAPARARPPAKKAPFEAEFAEVVVLIQQARQRAYQAVNTELVALYWQIGGYISAKLAAAEWGEGVVESLAQHLDRVLPGQRGFGRCFIQADSVSEYGEHRPYRMLYGQAHWFEQDQAVATLPKAFDTSHPVVDKAIDLIAANRNDGKPFISAIGLQTSPTPLQAPKAIVDKGRARCDAGQTALRIVVASPIPSASNTANVVLRAGFPFSLRDR